MITVENIQSTNAYSKIDKNDKKSEINQINKLKNDSFESVANKNSNEDKSVNGKFDISECAKNFFKGLISPVTALIKHPLMTLGVVAATAGACTLVPVLGPIMGIGFGALSAVQLGKGIYNVAKNYKSGNFDKAEKSFDEVGQGTVGVAMSAFGIKQGARVAKEAKLMNKLGVNSLSAEQKAQIASEVKSASNIDAIKEIGSLFTSKAGLKAVGSQFKPSNIAQKGKNALKFLFKKEDVTKIKKEVKEFAETTEGKRRAAMTNEEIESQVKALYKEAFDEYGIPEELRPQLEIYSDKAKCNNGGGYNSSEHKIKINSEAYRKGIFDLPDVIKHEATHANESILRQRLPLQDKEKATVDFLLDKIQNGDKNQVLTGEGDFLTGMKRVKTPKMNNQMKTDFSKLAQEKLYQMKTYSNDELIEMVKPLVNSNPDFVKGYGNIDDALNAMTNYAKNHNFRYRIAMEHASGFNTSNIDTSLLKELSEEEKIAAIKSFKEGIDCLESNGANNGGLMGSIAGTGDFTQYEFSPEEVMAQERGNEFEISKLEAQLKQLKANKDYDLAEEARLLDQIKKSKLTVEYKTKGREMYKLKTESYNHPENKELAKQVKTMEEELQALSMEIKKTQGDFTIDELMEYSRTGEKSKDELIRIILNNPTYEYSTYIAQQRPPFGATVDIPLTTTTAANIIAEDISKDKN